MEEGKKRQKYLEALQDNPFFSEIPPRILRSFLESFEEEVWPINTCSIDSDKTLHKFHIIISGRIKMYQINPETGREFTMFLLSKNDIFDVLCLLDSNRHQVFYESLDKVLILSIPIETMRQWIKHYPSINKNLMPYLSRQIRALEEYASNITLSDISHRLARLILRNINTNSHKLELINDLSNEEIANLIGSTRTVVNRHLQQFQSEGILKLGRKKLEVKNLKLLFKKLEQKKGFPPDD